MGFATSAATTVRSGTDGAATPRPAPAGLWREIWKLYGRVRGGNLAILITLNVFLIVMPVFIMVFAYLDLFGHSSRTFADFIVSRLALEPRSAELVRTAVTSATSSRTAGSILAIAAFAVFGGELIMHMQRAFNRPWDPGRPDELDYVRGIAWFALGGLFLSLSLIPSAVSPVVTLNRRLGFVPITFVEAFVFWLWSSKLLTRRSPGWRRFVPGSLAGAAALSLSSIAARYILSPWIRAYDKLLGPVGIVIALLGWTVLVCALVVAIPVFNAAWAARRNGGSPAEQPAARAPRRGRSRLERVVRSWRSSADNRRLPRMVTRMWMRARDVGLNNNAGLLTMDVFLVVLPVLIVTISLLPVSEQSHRTFADVLTQRLFLRGQAAGLLRATIESATDYRPIGIVVGTVSILVFGRHLLALLQDVFDRPWHPDVATTLSLRRGLAWLALAAALVVFWMLPDLRFRASGLFTFGRTLVQSFLFWLIASKMLARRRRGIRRYLPGATAGAVFLSVTAWLGQWFLSQWLGAYNRLFGIVGIVLATLAWVLVLCYGVVLIPVFSAVWAEEFPGRRRGDVTRRQDEVSLPSADAGRSARSASSPTSEEP